MNGKFEPGQIVITRKIADRISSDARFQIFVSASLERYVSCDWGDIYDDEKEMNDNFGYVVSDRVVEDGLIADEKTATTAAKKLLPDATLVDEINRIFSSSHPRDTFYGIPVHYKISVKSDFVADEMVDLLVGCLYGSTLILPQEVPFVYCPFLLDLFTVRLPLYGRRNRRHQRSLQKV